MRISRGDRIARMPGATVHIARAESREGWVALCGADVYRPSRSSDAARGPKCADCIAIEKATR